MTNTEQNYPQAELKTKKRLSAVWLLPVVAAAIAMWLLYENLSSNALQVTVHFDNGSGITAGKTPVVFQGITVGSVSQLQLDDAE